MSTAKRPLEDESLDDDDTVSKRVKTIWGGFVGALSETSDFRTADPLLPPLYNQGIKYLEQLSATKTVSDLLAVMDTIPWPPSANIDGPNWVNALNSPTLDVLLAAYRSRHAAGNALFFPATGPYYYVQMYLHRQSRYAWFVRCVVNGGNEAAFEFLCDRGVDFAEFPELALTAALEGSSLSLLRKLLDLTSFKLPCSLIELAQIKTPAILEFVIPLCDEALKHRVLERTAFHHCNNDNIVMVAQCLKLGLAFSFFDNRFTGYIIDNVEVLRQHGVVVPVASLTHWAEFAIADDRISELRRLLELGALVDETLPAPRSHTAYTMLQTAGRVMTADALETMVRRIIQQGDKDWLSSILANGYIPPPSSIRSVFIIQRRPKSSHPRSSPFLRQQQLRMLIKAGVVPPIGLATEFPVGCKAMLKICRQ